MNMAITGHRPNKLWGYSYKHPKYIALGREIKNFILDAQITDVYTGMALGVDTICALVVLKLKREGHKINLHACIPCLNHTSKWQKESADLWQHIVDRADTVTYVSDKEYDNSCMQKRNIHMVDNAHVLLAVWDGTRGGTGNCVKYAEQIGVKIVRINPNKL